MEMIRPDPDGRGGNKKSRAAPGILGINAGAGFGIAFMFLFQGQLKSAEWMSVFSMPLFGWIGGVGTALIIYWLSRHNGVLSGTAACTGGRADNAGRSGIAGTNRKEKEKAIRRSDNG
ncbi:iron chelate uptake ABC transporter family permease subunit [Brevibacillus nitrificans]|uniref:iron chelate uptake ABC transporter family permease subunit n=1 Tax=Brevibacillus nitrificans TaxID=651560 RepID=UPI00399C6CF0